MLKNIKDEDFISFFGFGLLIVLVIYSFIDSSRVVSQNKVQVAITPSPSILPSSSLVPTIQNPSPSPIATSGSKFQINVPKENDERED